MKLILTRMPALEAALTRFVGWWSTLSRRERILVGTMATLLVAVVLIFGVIKPLQSSRADALADIRTYETLNARILAAGTLTATPAVRRQGAPLKVAGDSAGALGLNAVPEAIAGGVRVTIADANYDNLMAWLADLVATSDLRATRVSIQRGKAPGRVFRGGGFRGMNEMLDLVPETPATLPYSFARKNGVLLRVGAHGLECVHRPGATLDALLEVQRIAPGAAFVPLADTAFDAALSAAYGGSGSAADIDMGDIDLAALADSAAAVDDLLDTRDDAPVIRLINALLLEAVKEGASDVHIETQEKRLVVRFRIDGVLRDKVEPPRALAPLLVSRIKVMAKLDIAERRVPQDGRVTLRIGGHDVDARVSTIPTQHGERVVMRLLEKGSLRLDLEALGMSDRDRTVFNKLLERPHGMLLVTGPTGSGKTTTLYAALNTLNDRKRNIMTVEDPIEYELAGIGQTQVNPRTDLTFARGLRAILRQDPDVIMVGEIRDQETAQVAVRSSMTGHFVLSTLHTNSAVGSVTRLIDMGVERYLLAPMVVGLAAQRLVRRLCPTCRRPDVATKADSILLGGAIAVGDPLYRAEGCVECHNDGYRGRAGLYEVVEVDDKFQKLIHDGASEAELEKRARKRNPSLLDDGVAKISSGVTTVDEVARVVRDEA